MSFLSFFLGEKKKTATVAKERLQMILMHERSGRNAAEPDYLPDLQRDLVAVISKYRWRCRCSSGTAHPPPTSE